MTDNERRQYQRVTFIAGLVISLAKQQWHCELEDISLKGFLIQSPDDLVPQLNTNYEISLLLSEDTEIKLQAKISHTEENLWGFHWVDIDLSSLSHLRRLMELNSQEPESIKQELSELSR